jgi:hypothetical protein
VIVGEERLDDHPHNIGCSKDAFRDREKVVQNAVSDVYQTKESHKKKPWFNFSRTHNSTENHRITIFTERSSHTYDFIGHTKEIRSKACFQPQKENQASSVEKNTTTERLINGKKRRQSNTTTTTTKSSHIKLKKKPEKSKGNIETNLVDQHGLWRRLPGFHFHLCLRSAAIE